MNNGTSENPGASLVQAFVEALIQGTPDGRKTFFETSAFDWAAKVENEWRLVRQELDALLVHHAKIPNFQDVSIDQLALTQDAEWKTYIFYAYGHVIEENCSRCPETTRILNGIPGLKSAMFSILSPGKHIPEHRGPFKGVLRYHLGLLVPRPSSLCRIRVGDDIRSWEEGKSLIFDDTHPHEVWNDASGYRAVLFVDFVRPLPASLHEFNMRVIDELAQSPFVLSIADKARSHDQAARELAAQMLDRLTQQK